MDHQMYRISNVKERQPAIYSGYKVDVCFTDSCGTATGMKGVETQRGRDSGTDPYDSAMTHQQPLQPG